MYIDRIVLNITENDAVKAIKSHAEGTVDLANGKYIFSGKVVTLN
jgi:hypothetical protein